MFTRYGTNTIVVVLIIAIICAAIGVFKAQYQAVRYILFAFALFITLFTLYFFRDPERTTPQTEGIVFSPADGKIVLVKKVDEQKFLKGPGTQVSIFMSPLSVHVNRVPISGVVKHAEYIKGKYLVAFDDKASSENERNEIGIESKFGRVLFTQIAGYVARRIISEVKTGDSVTAGKRFGMIKFGSRVDVIVPADWDIQVKTGDKVTAGVTIISSHPAGKGSL
jgi:phosphatidylserine decarboxylase